MKEITINNETYIKKSDILGEYKPSPIQIVILQRGWIAVGKVNQEEGKTYIRNASIIRRWGTTEGLGQLAEKGKLKDTILDKCPDILVENSNIVFIMNCNQKNWEDYAN